MFALMLLVFGLDPFAAVEFYAFRIALLLLFLVGLYKFLKREITK